MQKLITLYIVNVISVIDY